MKKIFLFLLLIVLCQINKTFAQELNTNEQEQIIETTISKKNSISFYPLNLFNLKEPSFQLGYERWLSNKVAIKMVGGFLPKDNLYDYFNSNIWLDKTYSCYKFNLDVKHVILTSNSLKHNLYISSEIFYANVYSKEVDTYKDLLGEEFEEISKSDVNKFGLSLKIGKQFFFNRFLLEFYGGIGLGKHFEDIYKKEREYKDFTFPYYEITDKSLEYYKINFPFNIIIGYRF